MKMAKGKEKEIRFDPTIYDYLDKVSTDGWISAFLSRNSDFILLYDKIMSLRKLNSEKNDFLLETMRRYTTPERASWSSIIFDTINAATSLTEGQAIDSKAIEKLKSKGNEKWRERISDLYDLENKLKDNDEQQSQIAAECKNAQNEMYNKYGVIITSSYFILANGMRIINVLSPNRISAYRVISNDITNDELHSAYEKEGAALREKPYAYLKLLHNSDKDGNIRDISPSIIFKYLFPEFYYDMPGEQILSTISDMKIGDSEPVRNFPPQKDSLVVRIDLRLGRDEIMRQIGQYLDIHVIGRKTKNRDDKWKYYLMVYDLYREGHIYAEICEILTRSIRLSKKELGKLFDERNIENYYKNALALINGEYKKYI
ncbi:hypothetical protein [Candidatus Magnetominusculus dajiuhuensis]|uniref:hypothetical protein n=1 Tax=Candidatus Magnetominusculus dajiuhuensis TaxID=3137712 RepID=UPI003B43C0F1